MLINTLLVNQVSHTEIHVSISMCYRTFLVAAPLRLQQHHQATLISLQG